MSWTVEEQYKNDSAFHAVVDSMRYLLREYKITPGELRSAAVLAATMHEMYTVKPLFIMDVEREQKAYAEGYPAMFGKPSEETAKTATGYYNWDMEQHKFTPAESPDTHAHVFINSAKTWDRDYKMCYCGMSDVYYYYWSTRK